ncbi:MAG TPA: serine/threonine-protein kinase [Holophagaceae bacterium]|nr:serine/threonine-protein kinase [Holophagaceae bacterium]
MLAPGNRLGPYEILTPLGAGGMGEVWKAKDTRLDRIVAVKVLPEHLTSNPDSLARFEREAKAVAALSHPNILGLFDIGKQDGTSYAVMELLEGESLRERLGRGPLPPRKATELAAQMAHGLAAAHGRGIIHRDLKPENLWITKDGRLKILDFGLAKSTPKRGAGSDSLMPTEAVQVSPGHHTQEGMILGTVGYMSPEQVRGEAVDARSDLFSFGAVLFEMLTGTRAFARATASDTLAAILRDDPPDLESGSGRVIPAGLRRILEHCLEKDPGHRFHDAQDLAFALESAAAPSSHSESSTALPPLERPKARLGWLPIGAVPLLALGLFGAWRLGRGAQAQPTFKRLTYGKGTVDGARFAPGSRDVVFSARWNGEPPEVFSLNPAALEPRSLGAKGGTLLSVSPSGELALKMKPRLWAAFELGQLARVSPGGGIRIIREDAFESDWMPDGGEMALVVSGRLDPGQQPGKPQQMSILEFPTGHAVASDVPFTWAIRVSPRGDRVACFEQPTFSLGDGHVVLVDLEGNRTVLAEAEGLTGLAWGPEGDEVWFSEFKDGCSSLWAVTTSGRKRLLLRQAGQLALLDVARDGRVLATLGLVVKGTMGMSAPDFREKDLSWNEATYTHDISPDGKRLLIGNGGFWSSKGERMSLYLRTDDGALPTRLGDAASALFLPDGQRVLTTQREGEKVPTLSIIPLGPGQSQVLEVPELKMSPFAELVQDGRRALIPGTLANSFQLLDLGSGARVPLGEKEMSSTAGARTVSPDGAWVLLRRNSGKLLDAPHVLISTKGAPSRPVPGIEPGEVPMRWNADGTAIYVFNRDGLPARIHRIELATGKRTFVREIMPTNPAGLPGIRSFTMTPDAQHLAYNYVRTLSDLYLIEGLK